MSFPRYPAYKPSGVEWLGEVPEHWSVNRFKLSVDSCMNGVWGNEASNDENDVICIRVADFDRHHLEAAEPDEPTIRNVSDRDIDQRSLRHGDLLIEKSGGGEKQPVGAVVLYIGTAPVVCSNFVARMRLKRDLSPSFWRYVHHAAYYIRLNTKSIKQTSGIQNLDQQQYLDESAPYPPLEEQVAIAAFLDRETAKIDALIAEQQRLMELLQEKRQAVISHAVTKGLNPNAPMKDSGVEWLGEVPEHWNITRLDRVGDFEAGKAHEPFVSEGGIYALANARFVSTNGNAAKRSDVQLTPALEGDILMVMSDLPNGRALARAYHVGHNEKIAVNQRVCRIRITRGTSRFYYYFLNRNPGLLWFNDGANQTHIPNSGFTKLVAIEPPLNEQQAIVGMLDCLNAETDRLMEIAEDMSKLLVERRSALISAAVTGQIDVRGLVEAEGNEL